MDYQHLKLERDRSVAIVTLNRPDLHNAFNEILIAELKDCFDTLGADPSVKAIVLGGEGKSFCAGADLSWMGRMAGFSKEENEADARQAQQMFAAIDRCPKPTIARVHGAAMGGGVGLIAACDLAIAVPEAKFAFSEVKLGIIPAIISPFVIARIGSGHARALFVTGERFDAQKAFEIGLIHQIVPAASLDQAVSAKLELLLANSPQAMSDAKTLVREVSDRPLQEAADLTIKRIAASRVSEEGQEGIKAFLEKRTPSFAQKTGEKA